MSDRCKVIAITNQKGGVILGLIRFLTLARFAKVIPIPWQIDAELKRSIRQSVRQENGESK